MINTVCMWLTELVPLGASAAAFIYGVNRFFEKGKALYLQIITIAMGCYALGNLYHLCQRIVLKEVTDGFTAAYLGHIGFYLFLFTANFGQMDGLMDDGTKQIRASRYIGLAGPVLAVFLYLFCAVSQMPLSTKITYGIVWIPAMLSLYYNLKHAVIPDLGFGFAKAVRPYNISAFVLSVLNLLLLCSWINYDETYGYVLPAVLSVIFGIGCLITMRNLEKGVMQWTI